MWEGTRRGMKKTQQPVSRLEVRFGLVIVAIFAICAVTAVWLRVKHSWGLALEANPSPVAELRRREIELPELNSPGNSGIAPSNQSGSGLETPPPDYPIETISAVSVEPPLNAADGQNVQPNLYQPTESERPLATAFATVTVEAEDTIWTVAERHYPSIQYAHALWRHNREKFPHPRDLAVGAAIEIPSPEYLRAAYPETFKPEEEEVVQRVEPPAPTRQYRTYTVQAGDSLFSIARSELGATARWVELFRMNRPIVGDDPAIPPVGAVINLPLPANGS